MWRATPHTAHTPAILYLYLALSHPPTPLSLVEAGGWRKEAPGTGIMKAGVEARGSAGLQGVARTQGGLSRKPGQRCCSVTVVAASQALSPPSPPTPPLCQ